MVYATTFLEPKNHDLTITLSQNLTKFPTKSFKYQSVKEVFILIMSIGCSSTYWNTQIQGKMS